MTCFYPATPAHLYWFSYKITPPLHASLNSFTSNFTGNKEDNVCKLFRLFHSSVFIQVLTNGSLYLCAPLSICNYNEWPSQQPRCRLLAVMVAGNPCPLIAKENSPLWTISLTWKDVKFQSELNVYVCRAACLCSVNQRHAVKLQHLLTPKQIGKWVAQQINDSIDCQLSHEPSFVALFFSFTALFTEFV